MRRKDSVVKGLFQEHDQTDYAKQDYAFFDKNWNNELDGDGLLSSMTQDMVEDSQPGTLNVDASDLLDDKDQVSADKKIDLHPLCEDTQMDFDSQVQIPPETPTKEAKVVSKFVFDPLRLREANAQRRRQEPTAAGCCVFMDGYISSPEHCVEDTLMFWKCVNV